ncbi:DNA glycosylase AlkZ-like family protein [Nocardioides marmotae]|uniref:DNA glycosylase AlkZ-like family protein n=1 Tax=Nocardioides marmotae TaxID=2663857 RepID=UPI0012B60EC2|nr:crosslink repair DNA glycosylase YcaQ family protein [Nocardioides marmotae]MBC9734727.1 winged helix DNA-binding domain-containing protein [Nocardioides marmotae]MTB85829.1 winged helix DNA-binding domain-containing protein [Nocardioides marmotae]
MATPTTSVGADAVLRFRVRAQQLDRPEGRGGPHDDAAVLDLGVQETGPDGARWALALRGAAPTYDDRVLAWTLRGAPHLYRRGEVAEVAAATVPWSEADAAKRIFDASRPLRAAGIPVLDALDEVGRVMREVVTGPAVKGEVSRALHERLPAAYQRECRPCGAVHVFEQPFRLAALPAGLELEPGTSPPVLRPVPGWAGRAATVPPHLDVVRAVLRLLGPATPQEVAGYVDAPVREVRQRWPEDAVDVAVDGRTRSILAADLDTLVACSDAGAGPDLGLVRLLGPFDLFLQGRDREVVVPDERARKDLWRTLGRPGGLLVGHRVVGTWRPRSTGGRLRLQVTRWDGAPLPAGVEREAERLATFRGQAFAGFVEG